jgi:hypothetical protein
MVEEATLPAGLIVTARTTEGIPMALEHAEWPLFGVQFHPESILTQEGHRLLANFLNLAGIAAGGVTTGELGSTLDAGESLLKNDPRFQTQPLHW